MSKSRLEKFLYALYSLDSSDLPNPLSRIEELYNCLVTGEEPPTFEPLSRVEKYLMAILEVYDVDSLPNPLSRVEVLLHKLATGDDNLDDIKSFLSEHEELLAEIIRNGGVGGNIDIEYALYTLSTEFNTLYNTAEKPVKSAILKGKTLVNLHKLKNYSVYGVVLDGGINQHFGNDTLYATWRMFDISMLKPNTEYGVFCWVSENTLSETYWECHVYNSSDTVFNAVSGLRFNAGETGMRFGKLTTISDFTGKTCGIRHVIDINTPSTEYVKFRCVLIEYQEGMENWDIPYFEGMQSVKMPVLRTTGKNLFNMNIFKNESDEYGFPYEKWKMQLKPNTTYIANSSFTRPNNDKTNYDSYGAILNGSKQIEQLYLYHWNLNLSFVNKIFTTDDTGVIYLGVYKGDCPYNVWDMVEMQIEEGSTATSYEPYKSNILTANEEVELRGIGDVQDELNLITGELTQRIGEYQITGEENWQFSGSARRLQIENPTFIPNLVYSEFVCDKLQVKHSEDQSLHGTVGTYYIGYTTDKWLRIILGEDLTSLKQGKEWLKANKPTIQYQLKTESIKTVDLSVVDQDGNSTKLSTFNDITHVTLSSEGLIPEAELEVATKNEEVLSTMSLEMNDISTTQNALQETSDIQSENVDATMIATTEIYEELL